MFDLLKTKLHCVVISTDIPQNKKYILSLDPNAIVLPNIECNKSNIQNINATITDYLKSLILVNEMEMMPQLISLNEQLLPNKNSDDIDTIFGFLVSFTISTNSCYWLEFDFFQQNDFNPLIVKVIQNLS